MIFVILGTQKFQFNRLLQMVDNLVEKQVITEPVFAQTGYSTYVPKNYEAKNFFPEKEFRKMIEESRFVISHGGIGSMMSCLEKNKRVVVVPRNVMHDEHIDNHQYQLASLFKARGHILMVDNEKQLMEACAEIELFHPVPYEARKNHIERSLEHYILKKRIEKNPRVLMVGSALSVKGGIVSVIRNLLDSDDWDDLDVIFVPTHVEGTAIVKMLYFMRAFLTVRRVIRKHKVPLIHIHVSERGSFIRKSLIIKMAKRKGCKIVLHHHGAEFEQYYRGSSKKHQQYISEILELADLNLVLSERSKPFIQQVGSNANVEVLYNSVEVDSINRYNSKGRDILMLGRLEQRKGTFELLETIANIDSKLPKDVMFYLCGDGDLDKVHQAIERLAIGHRIAYVGWADSDKKEEVFKRTMCHVLFSHNEGLPMAILETMGYGIPNISTNIASIPEVVKNGVTGILLEPGDQKALGEAILKVASDEAYRKNLSVNAHRLIYEKFSLENGIKILQTYYEKLMNR